ncbi:unnamed protein product [Vitrella brassicaformis CCMP3155]|uniref:Aminotransferase class I/classII large domain-containing protein n=1 Tax=Vitrella brassicaformis (strain CCMP3155) TaxID=1169540 RepID=A0A0G4FPU9_VITBC|nr:unnamed protein product [Vitrella brassicaformis CCMP3155]|eukprot:CEM16494.1 unnamed protein product [Vitrella brassicaformis CCMP3155]
MQPNQCWSSFQLSVRMSSSSSLLSAHIANAKPLRWEDAFAERVSRRIENQLVGLHRPIFQMPSHEREKAILLAGGLPPAEAFPIEAIELTVRGVGDGSSAEKVKVTVDDPKMLYNAQQYGSCEPLREWAQKFMMEFHQPVLPFARPPFVNGTNTTTTTATTNGHHEQKNGPVLDTILTAGNSDTLDKIASIVFNPTDGVFADEHAYSTTMLAFRPYINEVINVESDDMGIIPEALREACESYIAAGRGKPKALYVVPVGSNPEGKVTSEQRILELYAVARAYDMVVIEDDPYWFLRYPSYHEGATYTADKCPGLLSLKAPPPTQTAIVDDPYSQRSFLSFDIDGRVIRVDTFSKCVAPGLRTGWCTASKAFTTQYYAYTSCAPTQSAMAQTVVYSLLRDWGIEGFDRHVRDLQFLYWKRRDQLVSSLVKHCGEHLAMMDIPVAGMFLWPSFRLPVEDSAAIIPDLLKHRILVAPGNFFSFTNKPSPAVRIAFCCVDEAKLDTAAARLGEVLREKWVAHEEGGGHKQKQQQQQQNGCSPAGTCC